MKLAVIPARGGSKRIPRKNIREFFGKPMIAWTIETATRSGLFDRVVVSTDDDEIASVAREHGAEIPFVRPAAIADDMATTGQVMRHAVEVLQSGGQAFSAVCCIYPTAPFMRAEDLAAGLTKLVAGDGLDYVFSATEFGFPIQRAFRLTAGGAVEMLQPGHLKTRSQDLEPCYHDAGQFYWGTADAWLAERPVFASRSAAILLPRRRVHDIDTPEDWAVAELAFKVLAAQS
ncbi:MAG: pseudaminic acid cytidylyltransferase [Gammaproteobacteria bacterium]